MHVSNKNAQETNIYSVSEKKENVQLSTSVQVIRLQRLVAIRYDYSTPSFATDPHLN